jgi:NAD(P)-dependent dehydrogenase (short-subunit alcohol dehydrogenase family)
LALEVAADGIRVNAVRAGLTATDIHEATGNPARVERITLRIPMKRIAQPAEIAAAIVWLLSDEASYVTGALLDVTGGL